jgi:hypothetical protein
MFLIKQKIRRNVLIVTDFHLFLISFLKVMSRLMGIYNFYCILIGLGRRTGVCWVLFKILEGFFWQFFYDGIS